MRKHLTTWFLILLMNSSFSNELNSNWLRTVVENNLKMSAFPDSPDCRIAYCTNCVSSKYACSWCIDGNQCTNNATSGCHNDIIVSGVNVMGPNDRSGPNFCPRISATNGENEILIPAGTKKSIRVKAIITGQFIVQSRFMCVFIIETKFYTTNATILGDNLYCDPMEFQYTAALPSIRLPLIIIWGESKPLDNPDNIEVVIYRCNLLASDSRSCAALSKKYSCAWCPLSASCEIPSQCHKNETVIQNTDNCGKFSSCTSCVSSEVPCSWCIEGNRCTNNATSSCHNDILVSGVSLMGPNYQAGHNFCPRISALNVDKEILIPAGTKKSIRVKTTITGQFIVQSRFVCQFIIEGQIHQSNAKVLGDNLYCDPMEFQYASALPSMRVPFAVIWGGSKPLDNPQNIEVFVYRCNLLASDAESCAALPKKFSCAWCPVSASCEIPTQCQTNQTIIQEINNCDNISSCTSCVNSKLSCSWCIDGHRCTDNATRSCHKDILVGGTSLTGPNYRSGPNFCPRISATNGENEILIPAGTRKSIRVKATINGQLIVQSRYFCQFNIEGTIHSKHAQLLGNTFYCDALQFEYSSILPNITIPLAIVWDGSKALDNPDNIHVIAYRCSAMAKNSHECSILPNKYACNWCSWRNTCEYVNMC